MKHIRTKRIVSLILAVLTITSLFTVSSSAASSTNWPSDVSKANYVEIKAPTKILCYRDSGLSTRGTCEPNKAYNSYIDAGDLLYAYEITSTYTMVNFPTSSGRRTAYVSTASLFGVSAPIENATATTKVKTYSNADVTTSSSSGSVFVNEVIWKLGSTGNGAILILYPADSGNRAYKAAFVSKNTYSTYFDSTKNSSNTVSISHGVPLYRQYDSRWASIKIGNKSIKQIGCLLSCTSMVYSYDTGTTTVPPVMKEKLTFSNNDLVWSSLTKLGYTRSTYNQKISQAMMSKICAALQSGPVIIGAVNSSGGQHWVVITGYTGPVSSFSAANFSINDPNSSSRTNLAQFLNAYPTVKGIIS